VLILFRRFSERVFIIIIIIASRCTWHRYIYTHTRACAKINSKFMTPMKNKRHSWNRRIFRPYIYIYTCNKINESRNIRRPRQCSRSNPLSVALRNKKRARARARSVSNMEKLFDVIGARRTKRYSERTTDQQLRFKHFFNLNIPSPISYTTRYCRSACSSSNVHREPFAVSGTGAGVHEIGEIFRRSDNIAISVRTVNI